MLQMTYIVLQITGDCHLSRVPCVGLIARHGPDCLVATGGDHVHVECADSTAIHVVPEVKALGSGGRELCALESSHVPWDSGSTGLDEGIVT